MRIEREQKIAEATKQRLGIEEIARFSDADYNYIFIDTRETAPLARQLLEEFKAQFRGEFNEFIQVDRFTSFLSRQGYSFREIDADYLLTGTPRAATMYLIPKLK